MPARSAALLPVEWIIRRRLLALTLRTQARSLLPGVHVAAWVAGTYMLVAFSIQGHDIVVLACGTLLGLATGLGVMRAVHRSQFSELVLLDQSHARADEAAGSRRGGGKVS